MAKFEIHSMVIHARLNDVEVWELDVTDWGRHREIWIRIDVPHLKKPHWYRLEPGSAQLKRAMGWENKEYENARKKVPGI